MRAELPRGTAHHIILIDACVGNHKPRPTRPPWHMMKSDRYEKNLAATGVGVGDIDYVMCTHLHADHVGWNTRLDNGRWVPTFPKAKYLFADRELAHWTQRRRRTPLVSLDHRFRAAGRGAKRGDRQSDHTLNELVRADPTPATLSTTSRCTSARPARTQSLPAT